MQISSNRKMKLFRYVAMDQQGKIVASDPKGPIKHEEAPDREGLQASLQARGLRVLLIEDVYSSRIGRINRFIEEKVVLKRSVSLSELEMFCRLLEILLPAGVNVLQTLELAADQTDNKWFRKIVLDVRDKVMKGASLSSAMTSHPKAFSSLMVSTTESGETSGTLPECMGKLAEIFHRADELRRDVITAVTYPGFILVFFAVLLVLIVYSAPFVISQMAGVDIEKIIDRLPVVIRICYWIQLHPWFWALPVCLLAMPLVFFVLGKKYRSSRMLLARMIHRIPLLGGIIHNFALVKMIEVFCMLQEAGVEAGQMLNVLRGVSGHALIEDALERVQARILKGQSRSLAFSREAIFPKLFVEMFRSGEESGNVTAILGPVGNYYYSTAKAKTDRLVSLIDPIMIVGIGACVGPVILSLYQSLFMIRQFIQEGLL